MQQPGLHVPTRSLPHRIPGLFSIDHIALSGPIHSVEHIDAKVGTGRLSDHDVYVVEADLPELDSKPSEA